MQVNKPKKYREAKKTADTTFDKIYKFYFGKKDYPLNGVENEIRERWHTAWNMLCEAKSRGKIVAFLTQNYDIGSRTAYSDISNAMRLFGNPEIGKKAAKRAIVNEWIIKGIEKAWDNDDMLAYERLIGKYGKINGLEADQDNPIADLLTKLKPTKIEFTLKPEQLQAEADKLIEDVIDVEHKDLPND